MRIMKIKKIKLLLTFIILGIFISIPLTSIWTIKVGSKVGNVKIRNSNDDPCWIPNLGSKVLTLFYTDPDVADQNDPFADKLKAAKLPKKYYKGIGIANLEDTWKPNSIVRMVARSKEKKYKSTILTDPEHIIKKKWRLWNCNEKSVVIVIDINRVVQYIHYGAMGITERTKTFKLIVDLIDEAKEVLAAKNTKKKSKSKTKKKK